MSNSFGYSGINGIEYFSTKTSQYKRSSITGLNVLTVIGYGGKSLNEWNTGHNIKITFSKDNVEQKEAFDEIISIFEFIYYDHNGNCINNDKLPFTIYLCGFPNMVKIPVLCSEGNGWDGNTSCLFAYLPAMIFDNCWNKLNSSPT